MVEIWRKGLVLVLFTVCILGCANAATDQGDGLCYFPFAFSPYSLRFLYSAYGYPFLPNLCDFWCCFFGSLSAFSCMWLKTNLLDCIAFFLPKLCQFCLLFATFSPCFQRWVLLDYGDRMGSLGFQFRIQFYSNLCRIYIPGRNFLSFWLFSEVLLSGTS